MTSPTDFAAKARELAGPHDAVCCLILAGHNYRVPVTCDCDHAALASVKEKEATP